MNKEKLTLDNTGDVQDLRKSIGQSEKKLKNSAQEFSTIPEKGTFSHIGTKQFDIPGVGVRQSLGLYTVKGDFISENTLTKQVLLDVLTEIRNGSRKGKYMLKSERINDLTKFGKSLDAQLISLQGLSFETQKLTDVKQYKQEFLSAETFDEVCQEADNKTSLKEANKCTEIGTGYRFTFKPVEEE